MLTKIVHASVSVAGAVGRWVDLSRQADAVDETMHMVSGADEMEAAERSGLVDLLGFCHDH